MRFDLLRERLAAFLSRTILWLVGLLLVIFTALSLLDPVGMSEQLGGITVIVRLLLVALLLLGTALLFYTEIRQAARSDETGLIVRAPGAITQVDISSARDRILKAVNDLPDIVSTTANVQAVRGRAEIDLNVTVRGDDLNVVQKQKEINRALKQVVNKQLGLQLAGRPHIHIQFYNPDQKRDLMESPPAVRPAEPAERREPDDNEERSGLRGMLSGLRRSPQVDEKPVVAPPPSEPMPALPHTPLPGAQEKPEVPDEEKSFSGEAADVEEDKAWNNFAAVLSSLEDKKQDESAGSDETSDAARDAESESDTNQPDSDNNKTLT